MKWPNKFLKIACGENSHKSGHTAGHDHKIFSYFPSPLQIFGIVMQENIIW